MINELKKYIQPVKDFWARMTLRTKRIIGISLGCVVLISVALGLLLNRTQYTVLYPGLEHDEAVQVMTELKNIGVDYKEDDGTIYVPSEEENSLRMQLANEGYPKTAPNYDFFTSNIGVMTTDYEKKIIQQYQLNQRLEDVIKTMDPIDNAFVTISIPDESDYAWDDKEDAPTASVSLKLKTGRALNAQQVSGIKQLVSKSVPDLTAENVSVIDNSSGEEMSSSSSSPESSGELQMDMTEFKLKIEQQYEDNLEKKITDHLANSYGKENVSVVVKSQMDLDKKIQDIITYQPSTSDGKGIVSESEEVHEEVQGNSSSAGGVAGTENNTETTTTYPGVTVNGNTITTKDSKTYHYLVSQVQEQIKSDAAALQDLTVSVIINDGAMTDREVEQVKNAVAFASGVDPAKVNVMSKGLETSAQPANTQPLVPLPGDWRILAAGAGVFLLIIILIVALLSARQRKRAKELEEKLMERDNLEPENLAPAEDALPEAEEAEAAVEEAAEPEEAAEEPEPEEEPVEEPEEEEPEEESEEEEEPEEEPEEPMEPEEKEEPAEPEEPAAQEEAAGELPEEEAMPTESIEEIRQSASQKEEKLRKDLQEFSSNNPEIAAQLIRSLLKGDDDRG